MLIKTTRPLNPGHDKTRTGERKLFFEQSCPQGIGIFKGAAIASDRVIVLPRVHADRSLPSKKLATRVHGFVRYHDASSKNIAESFPS